VGRRSIRVIFLAIMGVLVGDGRGVPGQPGPPRVETHTNPGTTLGIVRRPPASPSMAYAAGPLRRLPTPDPMAVNPGFQVDLRGQDVSRFDLEGQAEVLRLADFDSQTRWPSPERMPAGFDPERVMELGKNPGLGVRGLHARVITGRGVGVAIIDQTLLVDHEEYEGRLRTYEEIHSPQAEAQLHGPAVASLAVGKTVGVAPEADLYFIAEWRGSPSGDPSESDVRPLAESIDRVVAINRALPAGRKIRVISISFGWAGRDLENRRELEEAVGRAKAQGLFIVSTALELTYPDQPCFLLGLGREPALDPDRPGSYGVGRWVERQLVVPEPRSLTLLRTLAFATGRWWARLLIRPTPSYVGMLRARARHGVLLVPMDSRTTASPTGRHDYVFYRSGGLSWSVPYLAGLYALACQVKPDVTAEEFLTAASRTGDRLELPGGWRLNVPVVIVNPPRLIGSLAARP
jgi:hypothetical protein